jgi:hypothetical protein
LEEEEEEVKGVVSSLGSYEASSVLGMKEVKGGRQVHQERTLKREEGES